MPFCVREFVVLDGVRVPVAAGGAGLPGGAFSDSERLLGDDSANHQSLRVIRLAQPVTTDWLEIRLTAPGSNVPVALFGVRCYSTP
jgi:hypothetical protein